MITKILQNALTKLAAVAALGAIGVPAAMAQDVPANENPVPANSEATAVATRGGVASQTKISLGVEAFYAAAGKDISCDWDDKIDLAGVTFRATMQNPAWALTETLKPEIFGLVSIGSGSEEITYYDGYGYREAKSELDVTLTQLAVGANLRWQPCNHFSAFVGARVGISAIYADGEFRDYEAHKKYDDDDTDIGFLYGVGVGAKWHITARQGVTVGVDWVGSTARPEVDHGKFDRQNYTIFSVGYEFTF